jgi:hypothetical protein
MRGFMAHIARLRNGCRVTGSVTVRRTTLLGDFSLVPMRVSPPPDISSDYFGREPLHLLQLRAALQQQKIHTSLREATDLLRDLFRRANEARAQPTIRD